MGRLEGRIAIVTGAARGIGAAEAFRLAQEGATVICVDLSGAEAAVVAEQITAAGGQSLALACNVADGEQVTECVTQVAERYGRLDILVNNAGILRDNLLFKMSDDDWQSVINVHLTGSFLFSRAAQAVMVPQRYGKIVLTSSISALGNRGQSNYAAAKAGLQGLTRTMAIELGPFNINVNAVAPGWIETDMLRATAERIGTTVDSWRDQITPHIPLRRLGKPEDVASVVAFLVSEDASYISGETIYVSGGPAGTIL